MYSMWVPRALFLLHKSPNPIQTKLYIYIYIYIYIYKYNFLAGKEKSRKVGTRDSWHVGWKDVTWDPVVSLTLFALSATPILRGIVFDR